MGGFVVDLGPNATYDHPIRIHPIRVRAIFEAGKLAWPETLDKEIEDRSKADWVVKSLALIQVLWFVVNLVGRWAQGLAITTVELYTMGIVICGIVIFFANWEKPFDINLPLVLQSPDTILSDDREELIQRVGRGENSDNDTVVLCLTIGVTLVFGAIHIGGWNFHFVTFAEQLIWRITSVSCTVIPVLLLLASFHLDRLDRKSPLLIKRPAYGGAGFYTVCRVYMFVEMFVSLRAVPASVYQTPQWSQYFPSFG
jgi:hypothetical protein